MKNKINTIQTTTQTIDRHPRAGGDSDCTDVACNVSTSSSPAWGNNKHTFSPLKQKAFQSRPFRIKPRNGRDHSVAVYFLVEYVQFNAILTKYEN